MSTEMNENVKRWTARHKMALVLDIIQGKTTTAEASRSFDLSPSEVETWIDEVKRCQNAFIERFNRSFRTEVLNANLLNSISEVQAAADDWVTDYNQFRTNESLGNVPPVQYMPRDFNGGYLHL